MENCHNKNWPSKFKSVCGLGFGMCVTTGWPKKTRTQFLWNKTRNFYYFTLIFHNIPVDSMHDRLEQQYSPKWLGQPRKRHFALKPILPTNHTQKCKQIIGDIFVVTKFHKKIDVLTGLRSLESMWLCKILILTVWGTLTLVGGWVLGQKGTLMLYGTQWGEVQRNPFDDAVKS